MSNKSEQEELIAGFLEQIKNNLPEWIKNDEEKLQDILLEIKSHIWDSAYELSGSDDPDVTSVQKAINNLGEPKEITKAYKARGIPKYFINEELWPYYTKILAGLMIFITAVMSIIQIVLIEPRNFAQAIINAITLSYGTITVFVGLITMLFVFFSKEGFLPEDFEKMDQKNKKDKKEKKFVYYKPGEHFFGGLMAFIFGLMFVLLPIDMLNFIRLFFNLIIDLLHLGSPINEYVSISADLRVWVTLMGSVSIIRGILDILRINSQDPNYHIKMNIFTIMTKLAELGLTVYILMNIELFLEVLPISETFVLFLGAIALLGNIAEIGKYLNQIGKLLALNDNVKATYS